MMFFDATRRRGAPVAERTRGYAHRIDINAPPELVWRGLIDPELLASGAARARA